MESRERSTSAKLARMLGGEIKEDDKATHIKTIAEFRPEKIKYIAGYIFDGMQKNPLRFFGHASFWDGTHYHSYGKNEEWVRATSDEYAADFCASRESRDYGNWTKILIPVKGHFSEALEKVHGSIVASWRPADYQFLFHNCVHMSRDYCERLGFSTSSSRRPSSFGKALRRSMKTYLFSALADQRRLDLSKNINDIENMRLFLHDLQADAHMPEIIRKKIMPLLQNVVIDKLNQNEINTLFCDVETILIRGHYSIKWGRSEENVRYYCCWLQFAFNVQPEVPNSSTRLTL